MHLFFLCTFLEISLRNVNVPNFLDYQNYFYELHSFLTIHMYTCTIIFLSFSVNKCLKDFSEYSQTCVKRPHLIAARTLCRKLFSIAIFMSHESAEEIRCVFDDNSKIIFVKSS